MDQLGDTYGEEDEYEYEYDETETEVGIVFNRGNHLDFYLFTYSFLTLILDLDFFGGLGSFFPQCRRQIECPRSTKTCCACQETSRQV